MPAVFDPGDLNPSFLQRTRRRFLLTDAALVRIVVASACLPVIRSLAIYVSKLGNGGIYLILPIIVLMRLGRSGLPAIFVAFCSVTLLHCFYPYIKRRVRRARPFQTDRSLPRLLAVLDEHSFPSGHTMTLSASLMPIVHVLPGTDLFCVGLVSIMAWARVASAHHYPSDVCVGAFLGGGLSYIASAYLLSPL
ncbi:MAG: phosphatase PAP2 family protein [Steroidobacteraceae bacterium]